MKTPVKTQEINSKLKDKLETQRKNLKLREKNLKLRGKNLKLKVKTQKVSTFRVPGWWKSVRKFL